MTELTCTVIAAIATIICSIVAHRSNISEKIREERSCRRERENRISMSLMFATSKLCTATANTLKNGGRAGKDIDDGIELINKAQAEYESFLMDTTAKQVAK